MINTMKEFKIRIDEAEIVDEDINSFLNCIPKHQEVDYVDIKKIIMKLIKKHDDNIISYEKLLSEVVCPTVHHNESTCPEDCSVTTQCDRMREVLRFVDLLVAKLKDFPEFKDFSFDWLLIGSTCEGSKLGHLFNRVP